MSHRIVIEDVVDQHAPDLMSDERDEFLAALYAWRDEALADAPGSGTWSPGDFR